MAEQIPVVQEFLKKRQLARTASHLRSNQQLYNGQTAHQHCGYGHLEVKAATIEQYLGRFEHLWFKQLDQAMKMRSNYILDDSQVTKLNESERENALNLHGLPWSTRTIPTGSS